jgi:3-isopropylmalate/(R)-2-methylmalate dehydratase large subunit
MGMTIIEKILARKAGRDRVEVGEFVVCDVDMTVLIDLQFATLWASPTRIADPDRLAVIMDHGVPAPSVQDADGGVRARAFVAQHGVERFFDVGRHGICHQVIAENGLARPGEILTCTDSHTCAGGAYNTAARGLGPAEVFSIMCTGKTWFQVAPTIRYELVGAKPDVISGKDIFLHIAGTHGDATNHNLELGGPGLASVPMNDRRTIATRGAEISADFTTFPADEQCRTFLNAHTDCPYEPADPDPDATYVAVREVDLSALEPYVARPGGVAHNALPISQIEERLVNQCFIGSCANGQLEDLRIAADVMRGQTVAPGVRLIVTRRRRRSTTRRSRQATWRRFRTPARSSPTPPAARASATTWACSVPARSASPRVPATSAGAWEVRTPRSTWPPRTPSPRPRSPAT